MTRSRPHYITTAQTLSQRNRVTMRSSRPGPWRVLVRDLATTSLLHEVYARARDLELEPASPTIPGLT